MVLYAKRMTFLFLLLTLSACDPFEAYVDYKGVRYCVLNQDVRPLFVGESWKPELGALDKTDSNCIPLSNPPKFRWRVRDMNVVGFTHEGALIGRHPGEIFAEAVGQDNNRLFTVKGFILPRDWEMEVDFPPRSTISVGEEKRVVVRSIDAAGQNLQDTWFWVTPKNNKVLSQRGCLPLRRTHECIVTGLKPGTSELRISVGGKKKIFMVDVH